MAHQASRQGKKSHAQIRREVDAILAGNSTETPDGSSLTGPQRFRVDVENQPRRIINSADEAIRYASRYVYLGPSETSKFREHLERGQPVAWAYGFTSVEIAPHPDDRATSSDVQPHPASHSRRKRPLTSGQRGVPQREVQAEEVKAEARALQALGDAAPQRRVLAVDQKLHEVLVDIDPFWVRWSAFIDGEGGGRIGSSWRALTDP
jgi:hypothetical protein